MTIQSLRGGVAILSLTALSVAMSAHAMLPTPTETPNLTSKQSDAGEVSYTANPQAKSNVSMTGKMAAVAPQSISIQNPLGQSSTPTVTPMTVSPPQTPQQGSSAGIWSVVNAFVVQNINGQETLTPINADTTVKSGDTLEYQGLFTNNSPERVRSMEVTLSIADGLVLVGGIHPKFPHATIDGSRFIRSPIRANIGGQVQELPLSDYKALRWTLEDIGIGGTSVVKYRAKLK